MLEKLLNDLSQWAACFHIARRLNFLGETTSQSFSGGWLVVFSYYSLMLLGFANIGDSAEICKD